ETADPEEIVILHHIHRKEVVFQPAYCAVVGTCVVLRLEPGPDTFQRTDGKNRRLVAKTVADKEVEIIGLPVSGIESA
ncbi:MAG: hypothetical protein AAB359_06605, partial [Elusimicrobiota bacterium]